MTDLTARNAELAAPLRERVKARRVETATEQIKAALPDHLPPPLVHMPSVAGTPTWLEVASWD